MLGSRHLPRDLFGVGGLGLVVVVVLLARSRLSYVCSCSYLSLSAASSPSQRLGLLVVWRIEVGGGVVVSKSHFHALIVLMLEEFVVGQVDSMSVCARKLSGLLGI